MKFELFEMLRYIDAHTSSDSASSPSAPTGTWITECPDKDALPDRETKSKKEFYDLLPQMTPSDLFRLYLHLHQEESSAQKCSP